ncbi:extracellular matrix organizing protein FRAS1 [Nematostella vectensis]|uniref:extracellular matrix organizing protein FRAS1 n=1 Tax=Nematostella vectensis TaxID=45351 RepID=UPI002076F715|nr:extracellular matrix organizing protein FRAS1 [Nematostella vectensis]
MRAILLLWLLAIAGAVQAQENDQGNDLAQGPGIGRGSGSPMWGGGMGQGPRGWGRGSGGGWGQGPGGGWGRGQGRGMGRGPGGGWGRGSGGGWGRMQGGGMGRGPGGGWGRMQGGMGRGPGGGWGRMQGGGMGRGPGGGLGRGPGGGWGRMQGGGMGRSPGQGWGCRGMGCGWGCGNGRFGGCPRIPGCINCPFNNNCTRCNPPLSLLSTGQRAQCVRTCPFRFSRMNVNGSFVCQWRGSLEGCLDSMCSGCKNGYYYLEKDGRFCHKSCPKGYFVSYGRCLKCLKSCESCSTAIKCEKCKKGLFKVRMPSRPQSAICVPECPQGYKGIVVNETSEQICQKVCHVTHCQSCESDSYHGQRHCDVCSPGYNKHKIYAKLGFGVIYDDECRKECPKGYQVEMNKLGGTECVKQIVKRPGPGEPITPAVESRRRFG